MNTVTVGNKIRKVREFKNLTQEFMAEKLGINQSSYARFENDVTELTISKLTKIAEVLEVSIQDILDLDKNNFFNNSNNGVNSGNLYSPINDLKLVEELIRSKDETIQALTKQIAILEKIIK